MLNRPNILKPGLWLAGLLSCLLVARAAEPPARSEYDVKAAFLQKFAMFVEWPKEAFAAPSDPLVIGILGQDPFGPKLEATLANKLVKGRPLVFRRFSRAQEAIEAHCRLLFIAASEKARLPEIFAALKSQPLLTVGDTPGYGEDGVMINLLLRDQNLRFEINQAAATAAGLKLSSQLLDLAVNAHLAPKPEKP